MVANPPRRIGYTRRHVCFGLFSAGLGLSLGLKSCASVPSSNSTQLAAPASKRIIRIGHQPLGTFLHLKASGNLEKRLAPLGIAVEWVEFAAGPPLLAAMGEGKIDLGAGGVVPPLFAQVKNVPFVYVANDPPLPESIGIIVPQDSPIQTLADLKGKKIAAAQASAAQYLLIRAAVKGGLTLDEIDFVDLPPPKAKEAFQQQQVDAWAIWQPFIAQMQQSMGARVLTDADGLMNDRNFYLATRSFANERAQIVGIVIEEARRIGLWMTQYPEEVAKIVSAKTGMNLDLALTVVKSRRYDAFPIQDRAIEEQQRIAETFFRLGLLPQRVWVEDAIWKQGIGV